MFQTVLLYLFPILPLQHAYLFAAVPLVATNNVTC